MSDEEYIKLLRATVPMLERIKDMPLKNWQFSLEELERLRLYQYSKPRYGLLIEVMINSVLTGEQFSLLGNATSLATTRIVHGIHPLTGEAGLGADNQLVRETWLEWWIDNNGS